MRVARACRALGLTSVGVYSEADRESLHVRVVDEAVCIGPPLAYLDIEAILAAAERAGARFVHPGYGFLAEDPTFARTCKESGLVFVGPSPEAMERLGRKREARELAASLGIPVLPGGPVGGDHQKSAREVGFPLLLKASAGGGGRGMRVVEGPGELSVAFEAARREAEAAFGDGTLLMERYLPRARHVEVQVLGDEHGSIVHLLDRDCTLQRRYQKLVEEAPAPGLSDEVRARMAEAALGLARKVSYSGAGTVEFVLDADRPDEFFFLEMNTRLQVEHPVTEAVTGIDLVVWQLRVARGEALTFSQEDVRPQGHAFEARVCAEDAQAGHMPVTGRIAEIDLPDGVRVDAGVRPGQAVTDHYDSLLIKVVSHGRDRGEALARLTKALGETAVMGVVHNASALRRLTALPEVAGVKHDTKLLERMKLGPSRQELEEAALTAALWERGRCKGPLSFLPTGWRNMPTDAAWDPYEGGGERLEVRLEGEYCSLNGRRARLLQTDGPSMLVEIDGTARKARVHGAGGELHVHLHGTGTLFLRRPPRFTPPELKVAPGDARAPMPGRVVKVLAAAGDRVAKGAPLVVLEAMKMETTVEASAAGTVAEVLVTPGRQVRAGELLAILEPES